MAAPVVTGIGGVVAHRVPAVVADRGRAALSVWEEGADAALRALVARVVHALVTSVDLTALVRQHVDLDAVATELDVDAVVARVDVDAVAARVDVNAVAARVDPDAVVARADLDAAAARLDLDRLAAALDLDAAAARLDLDRLAARLDPDAVVARVDLEAAIARIDLVRLAREVIEGVDLPDIVRSSTGTMATEAVRSVRTESMRADDAVSGFVDRLLRRSPRGEVPVLP